MFKTELYPSFLHKKIISLRRFLSPTCQTQSPPLHPTIYIHWQWILSISITLFHFGMFVLWSLKLSKLLYIASMPFTLWCQMTEIYYLLFLLRSSRFIGIWSCFRSSVLVVDNCSTCILDYRAKQFLYTYIQLFIYDHNYFNTYFSHNLENVNNVTKRQRNRLICDINNDYNNFPLTCDFKIFIRNNIFPQLYMKIDVEWNRKETHKSMKMSIRQVQIALPTFNGFNSPLGNKLFDLVFITWAA